MTKEDEMIMRDFMYSDGNLSLAALSMAGRVAIIRALGFHISNATYQNAHQTEDERELGIVLKDEVRIDLSLGIFLKQELAHQLLNEIRNRPRKIKE